MKSAFLSVEKLSRRYPNPESDEPLTVFEEIDFNIDKGEFICVIGHSGCGKSTILNILAGLDQPSGGYVFMEGRETSGPSLDRGVIFQNHSLLPWRSALGNVMLAVNSRWPSWSRKQVRDHSLKFIEMVGLSGAEHRKPYQLSGGMRQRVGIARAFAIAPKMLLMDEPFGALDALTRGVIQDELINLWSQDHQTVFMITHDVDEAILLADRILLMSNGPRARIAESVAVDFPRPRDRRKIVHHHRYYEIRNHLVDFLVNNSRPVVGAPEPEQVSESFESDGPVSDDEVSRVVNFQ